MVYVAYTEQEIQAGTTLIEMALKANGLQVAEAALVLSRKLQSGIPEDRVTIRKPEKPKAK